MGKDARVRGTPGAGFRTAVAALVCLAGAVQGLATPFGVNAHIPGPAVLDEISAAGIEWVRMDFRWDLLEPRRGRFDWSLYDPVVDAARARGLRIYATLQATPTWATSGPPGSGVPVDPTDWSDFCYEVAVHFRGRVDAWGMWNEPNLPGFWAGTREQYIQDILVKGGRAVHAADPAALVAGPDLAHLSSRDWEGWLEDSIKEGGSVLDVVTHHVYPSGGSHTDVTKKLESGGTQSWDDDAVREVLSRAGWSGRPFWLTETGMQSGVAGEADQAGFYTNLLADWFRPDRDLSWVDRIFFYEMVDDPAASSPTYGILGPGPDLRRKPAYYAYQAFITSSQVDDGEIIGDTLPSYLVPGEPVTATVTVRNTGTASWDAADVVLGSFWYGGSVIREAGHLAPATVVRPGALAVFTLTLGVPSIDLGGSPVRRLDLRLRRSGKWWFGTPSSWSLAVGTPPPVVVIPPAHQRLLQGQVAVLTVDAEGKGPLTYRWQRNGQNVFDSPVYAGAGTPVLLVLGVDQELAGDYRCVVGNEGGETASPPASLALVGVSRRSSAAESPVDGESVSRSSAAGGRAGGPAPLDP